MLGERPRRGTRSRAIATVERALAVVALGGFGCWLGALHF